MTKRICSIAKTQVNTFCNDKAKKNNLKKANLYFKLKQDKYKNEKTYIL